VANHTAKRCKFNKGENNTHDKNEPSNKTFRLAYTVNPSATKTWEKAKDEVYNALAKDSKVTDNELKASTDLIEELALFSLTKAQGAKKRFLNKIRKQLYPINSKSGQYTKYSKLNNNNNNYNNHKYKHNNNNYNNKHYKNNNKSPQDSKRGENTDATTSYDERKLMECFKCGRMAKHRASECKGKRYRGRRAYNATTENNDRDLDDKIHQNNNNNNNSNKSKRNDLSSDEESINNSRTKRPMANITKAVDFDSHVYSNNAVMGSSNDINYKLLDKFNKTYSSDRTRDKSAKSYMGLS
jgi:hypothetical protein